MPNRAQCLIEHNALIEHNVAGFSELSLAVCW